MAYNYGVFDFTEPDFLLNFLRGRLNYQIAAWPGDATLQHYAGADRTVVLQELALTPAQRNDLVDFLEWNLRPENRYYLYDYYRDNCSTRVRDAIDRVLGGAIRAQTAGVPTATTFRSHTRRLTEDVPITYTGIDLALGQPVDLPIDAYQEMFIPMRMRDRLADVTVAGPDGGVRPLVLNTRVIHQSTREAPPDEPPGWLWAFLLIGMAWGGGLYLLGRRPDGSRRRAWTFAAAAGFTALLVGVLGTILLLFWVVTDHTVTHANENLLQASPLGFALLLLVPAAALRGAKWRRRAARVAWVAAALSALGLVLQILPGLDQVNGQIIALLLPVHVGLALALGDPR